MNAEAKPNCTWLHQHSRKWANNTYVYPVISRRSGGLSVGINLSLDKRCNFDCIYCQVDRRKPTVPEAVNLVVMQAELGALLDLVSSVEFWQKGPFAGVEAPYRRLDNIAFSGDGEPTLCRWFEEAFGLAALTKMQRHLDDVKLVLITNAAQLRKPAIGHALKLMQHHQGEIWAKLDVGSERAFRIINRARFPLENILENLREVGREQALVIQSMFMRIRGIPPPPRDFEEYLDCLSDLRNAGCRIQRVQLYTVARRPAMSWVTPLSDSEMDFLAARFHARMPGLAVQAFYTQ